MTSESYYLIDADQVYVIKWPLSKCIKLVDLAGLDDFLLENITSRNVPLIPVGPSGGSQH